MVNNMTKAVYIHIPFCKSLCSYCDFCKMFYINKWVDLYLDCLEDEIKNMYENEKITSLYIGGGTPSSLTVNQLEKLNQIIKLFDLDENAEITFEANLSDLNDIYLNYLKNIGVNRLSIGVESFNSEKLKLMGRDADFDNASKIIKIARSKGFNNINVDFMYALPNETLQETKEDLNKIIKLKPDHVSTYSLILNPNTKLFMKYKSNNISEDVEEQMYKYICKTLKRHDFIHYEVSNFSKENKQSKHNLVYWNNEEYYGFGLGACGYIHKVRYENTKNMNKYLKKNYIYKRELVSIDDEKKNKLMLGLRLTKGIDLNEWFFKYNENLEENKNIKELINKKYLIVNEKFLSINPKKMYIMNEILIKII